MASPTEYITQLIQDLRVFSPDTLNLARQYVSKTELDLPQLEVLIEMQRDARSRTDLAFASRMHALREEIIGYLQTCLEQLPHTGANSADFGTGPGSDNE